MKKFKLSTPVRYAINLTLTVLLWVVISAIISGAGLKGEYIRGIVITIGINIILDMRASWPSAPMRVPSS